MQENACLVFSPSGPILSLEAVYKGDRDGWAKRVKDSVFGGAPCMWRVCVILHPALEYRLLFTGACEPPKHLSQCLTSRNRPPPLSLTSTLRKVSLQLIILGCSSSAHYDILLERHRYPVNTRNS